MAYGKYFEGARHEFNIKALILVSLAFMNIFFIYALLSSCHQICMQLRFGNCVIITSFECTYLKIKSKLDVFDVFLYLMYFCLTTLTIAILLCLICIKGKPQQDPVWYFIYKLFVYFWICELVYLWTFRLVYLWPCRHVALWICILVNACVSICVLELKVLWQRTCVFAFVNMYL